MLVVTVNVNKAIDRGLQCSITVVNCIYIFHILQERKSTGNRCIVEEQNTMLL